MRRNITAGAAVLAIAVALGAFGAHGLRAVLSPEALAQWRTGVEYQFYHGLGLLLLAALHDRIPERSLRLTGGLLLAGVVAFSGSLYLLATRDLLGTQGLTPFIGPVTPLGGLCFIAGWLLLLVGARRGH
ncbi:MAG: DUF423 domain-containing protein [Flavobacteriales bacterium]|jgi:uncharacterized membrane protein YgdD (TMEM256/DUF423 family)|nr:DUF423 domain-containing protein [Flavobacteriales bacterium]MBK7941899.1 DUF423 domain-containing protein [Flavobacteriales bacterium]MBK8947704.1 DUF423 domain-containing protein [Flavobacteriales bacterium]